MNNFKLTIHNKYTPRHSRLIATSSISMRITIPAAKSGCNLWMTSPKEAWPKDDVIRWFSTVEILLLNVDRFYSFWKRI